LDFAWGFTTVISGDTAALQHSLLFAALLATVVWAFSARRGVPGMGPISLWTFLFLATASHGVLDAMTDGGLGVAFFSPVDNTRYFLPFNPIRVSPIGISRFLVRAVSQS
jgi:inner membrane protein